MANFKKKTIVTLINIKKHVITGFRKAKTLIPREFEPSTWGENKDIIIYCPNYTQSVSRDNIILRNVNTKNKAI